MISFCLGDGLVAMKAWWMENDIIALQGFWEFMKGLGMGALERQFRVLFVRPFTGWCL